jgi:apolipoprotein N-acyltransferase
MSRLRAVESGRTVVQVATTGKSAIIGADGGVRAESGALYHSQVLVAVVPVRSARTVATRVGAIPEYVLSALAIAGLVYAFVAARRERRNVENEDASTAAVREEMVEA